MSNPITSFSGRYSFLSNFYPAVVTTTWGDIASSVEHAYQAVKMTNLTDYRLVLAAPSAAAAKRVARKLPRRPDWEHIKLETMRYYIRHKFGANAFLRNLLLETGDSYLIEGNTWNDRYWGAVLVDGDFVGENNLGKLLMEMRDEIRGLDNRRA